MIRRVLLGTIAVLFVTCLAMAGEPSIEGEWEIVSAIRGNKAKPADKTTFTFTKDKMTMTPGNARPGDGRVFEYSLDPRKIPKQISLTHGGKSAAGIYKFEDGQLVLCLPNDPDRPSPTEFKSPEGSTNALFTLKRKK